LVVCCRLVSSITSNVVPNSLFSNVPTHAHQYVSIIARPKDTPLTLPGRLGPEYGDDIINRNQHPSNPSAQSGSPGLVYNRILAMPTPNPKMRKEERKETYVNFFSSLIICIRSVLPWGCGATCAWGATTPFRETLDGGDDGGDDAMRVLCMCLMLWYVRSYNNENDGMSWDRCGTW